MPETHEQTKRPSIGPVPAATAQLMHDSLTSIFEWTECEFIPAERRLLLIRNACRVALKQVLSPTAEQFDALLSSPVALNAISKMTAEGFLRMCAKANYTLAQGAVCARSGRQDIPEPLFLAAAASELQREAFNNDNLELATAYAALKNEAAMSMEAGVL